MKKIVALTLALSLMLAGCGGTQTTDTPTDPTTQPTTVPTTAPSPDPEPEVPQEENFGIYVPDSDVELATNGAVKQYSLKGWDYNGLVLMGDRLLLLSGEEDCTLAALSPDGTTYSITLEDTFLSTMDVKYIPDKQLVAFYDYEERSMVLLSESLEVTKTIKMPDSSQGVPKITDDGGLIYYMTDSQLRYLDVETGIDRLLKEISFTYQSVEDIHFDGEIIECLVRDEYICQSMMISAETGALLYATKEVPSLSTDGQHYFATVWESEVPQYVFGTRGGQMQCLNPLQPIYTSSVDLWTAMTCTPVEDGFELSCYDLESGKRFSSVTVPVANGLWGITADSLRNSLWFVSQNEQMEYRLYQWTLDATPTQDETYYLAPYYTQEDPDLEGLTRMEERAREIGRKYGIRVWIAEEALQIQPSDYTFEAQHVVSVYDQYLTVLDQALSRYPDGFLKRLSSNCANGKLTISLIKAAYGDNGLGSLDSADGVHFFNDGSEYIGLVMGVVFESTLYHELFHSIDTYVISRSNLYDFWNDLNPEGFAYDNDYVANQFREDYQYLGEDRWFIDMYSMSYAKEDRARIMEYAMGEGNAFFFQSPHMQAKLAKLSEGIRTAFDLNATHGTFPWEQYLQ